MHTFLCMPATTTLYIPMLQPMSEMRGRQPVILPVHGVHKKLGSPVHFQMQRQDENITQKKRFRIFVEHTHNILHNPSLPASLALARKSIRHALSRILNINRNALHWDTLILKVTEDYFLIKPDTWTSVWIGLMHILLGGKAESKTHSYKSFRDSTQSWRWNLTWLRNGYKIFFERQLGQPGNEFEDMMV